MVRNTKIVIIVTLTVLIGTGINFIGTSNASYDALVDNETPAVGLSPESLLLYSRDNLTAGTHTVTLVSRATDPSTVLTFDRALIFNSEREECVRHGFQFVHNADVTPYSSVSPRTVDNSDTNTINYLGSWASLTDPGVPSVPNPKPFQSTAVAGDQLAFSFTGSAVAVYGSSNFGHGEYSVVSFISSESYLQKLKRT